jgi:O-antigen ligase
LHRTIRVYDALYFILNLYKTNILLLLPQELIANNLRRLFWAYTAIVLCCVAGAVAFQFPLLLVLPFGILVVFQAIVDYSKIFYVLLATLPMSMEFNFTPSLGSDLPSEPLTVGLMLVFIAQLLSNPQGRRILEVTFQACLFYLLNGCWQSFGILPHFAGLA